MVTKAYLAASLAALVAASLNTACRCSSDKKSAAKPAVPSASASAAPVAELPPERRRLADREPPNTEALISARKKVLDALIKIKALGRQKNSAEALAVVTESRSLDPLGAAFALEASRAATLAGDATLAAAWARRALDGAPPKAITEAALKILDRPTADPSGADVGNFDSIKSACAALEGRVHADKPQPFGYGPVANAKCEIEYELELGSANVGKASALRITSADKSVVYAYVGLETPGGVKVYGPVASAHLPPDYKLVNDFIVDLQRVDVIPAGAPEVVVKVDERSTIADLALNELAEVEQARVVILSVDRGKLEASREFLLSRSERKQLIDPKDRRLPAGYKQSPDIGKDAAYSMAVSWTGPNEITLNKGSGSAEPRDSGRIVLFP